MARGWLITFEGTEGGGKSTHLPKLSARLQRQGWKVCVCREPGGTLVGEAIRSVLKASPSPEPIEPETELLLMNACRAQLVRQVIRPALARGEIVLCDRFADSTRAYQGYGRGLSLQAVEEVVRFATGGLAPDLTLLLHIPVELSEQRRQLRERIEGGARDRFESADRPFFEKVQSGFDALARLEPERIRRIDASRSIPEVEQAIWDQVEGFLRSREATPPVTEAPFSP